MNKLSDEALIDLKGNYFSFGAIKETMAILLAIVE